MPQMQTEPRRAIGSRGRTPPPHIAALNEILNRFAGRLSGADAEPGPMPNESGRRMQRTQDIELDPMADDPGITPMRPRRNMPELLPNAPRDAQYAQDDLVSRVPGDGMPLELLADQEDPQSEMAMMGLREASGNLAPMLGRYGLGGSGNIDRSGGKTSVTIHGDPVQAEASRVRMLRDQARQAGDLNRTLASSRASMIADSRRMDPLEATRYERESIQNADAASPDMPDPSGLPTGVDEMAALRALLTRGRAANTIGREGAVSSAQAFMDPTVTAARGMARGEAAETQERDIVGRIKAQLAGNPDAAFMPELRKLLGLDTGEAEVGAGTMDTMTQQELQEFAAEQNMTPDEALQYVMRHGITVQ